jgi:hypothetical protein
MSKEFQNEAVLRMAKIIATKVYLLSPTKKAEPPL